MALEIIDYFGYPFRIDPFDRIQQHEWDHFVNLADEIAGESEHESGNLAFDTLDFILDIRQIRL